MFKKLNNIGDCGIVCDFGDEVNRQINTSVIKLFHHINKEIIQDLADNKKIVLKSILNTEEAKSWVMDTAFANYPPSHKGNWAQQLVIRYSLNLPKSEKTGKYSITAKNIDALDDSPQKEFLKTGDIELLDPVEVARISMSMWKESNEACNKHLVSIA